MALTALDIQQQSFGTSRHGYDPQEVDVFLERIAVEVDNFNRALVEAKNRFEAAEARAKAAEQISQQAVERAQQGAARAADSSVTEEQISRAFIAAQRSADSLKEEARSEAEKTYREAEQRARDIVRDATAEKQRILVEIDRLRESCEKFRAEYLSLINHFSADAKKVMPTIDAAVPDTTEAKASLDDSSFLMQNDAVASPPQASASAAARQSAASYAGNVGGRKDPFDPPAETKQQVVDFDDDLDIEEID